jgi:hypothetical protein
MKKQILKIAGVKSEKEFYKKFPTEEAFMAKHGKALKKAQIGAYMTSGEAPAPFTPIDVYGMQSDVNYAATGMTDAERRQLAAIQAQQNTQSQGGGGGSDQMMQMVSALAESGAAKKGKKIPKAQVGTGGLPRIQIPTAQQLTAGMPSQTITPSAMPTSIGMSNTAKKPKNWAKGIPVLGQIVGGIQKSKEAKNLLEQTIQQEKLTDVFSQAAASRPVQQPRRQYVRPEDVEFQPEQMFPSYGVGTNVLAQDGAVIGGNPTEIQNMYNPGVLYTDLGYEPLNDTSKVKNYKKGGKLKKAQGGFETFMNQQGGNEIFGAIDQLGAFNDGGGDIGSGIGEAVGMLIPGTGPIFKVAGRVIGSALDQKAEKTEAAGERRDKNISNIVGQSTGMAIQNMNRSFMQDGGTTSPYAWMSHTWQPQVITTFGEHKVKDLLKPPADADMLRAGGHLKEYTPPSARAMFTGRPDMQMGGELQTHWGGYAETLSENPYLPDGGETIMFRGQSHDESDGRGNTGIGITYGDNPVEVERGEPAVKLQDGTSGESNLTVFGNIKITNAFADMLADPKAKGKKFKTYVADLSKQENKQNKLIDKSIDQLDELNVQSSFDKLALGTLQANMEGANAKLKQLADKKINAASLQNAINDTKEEELVKITDKGDVLAKKGANIPKAQNGRTTNQSKRAQLRISNDDDELSTLPEERLTRLEAMRDVPKGQRKSGNYWGGITDKEFEQLKANNPWYDWSNFNPGREGDVQLFQKAFNRRARQLGSSASLTVDDLLGRQTASARGLYGDTSSTGLPRINIPNLGYKLPTPSSTPTEVKRPVVTAPSSSKMNILPYLNQALQYLRPSDVESLDPNQLLGEMYALSQNQVEPVYAQKFIPELGVPYDISLQNILNENEATFRSQQRLLGYNPAAQGILNSQKYAANQEALTKQFIANQTMKDKVYGENRNLLNQAKLQNLQILDTQAQRQAQALSNTKATTQAALNSIASKYAQNKLENRTLATYENLYNYRYSPGFRAINMNPLWDPNLPDISGYTADQLKALASFKEAEEKKSKKKARNGAISKAFKNI